MSRPGDAAERAADRVAARVVEHMDRTRDPRTEAGWTAGRADDATGARLPAAARAVLEPLLEADLSGVRLRAGPDSARSAAALGARAYTVGNDIVFGARAFDPGTPAGRRLIAHELAHVAQQQASGRLAVQRDVVDMEPITVTSTLHPTERSVAHLERLRGQGVDPNAVTVSHGADVVARNAPDPARVLPFRTGGGWDAQQILTALGQYDTMPGTDSDALRCVQAVAMASRIVDGPPAVIAFLRAMILEGMMQRPMRDRERTAIDVLEHVIGRIEMRRATFGDLLWAQEALHDLFYSDVAGTPEPDIIGRMAPTFEFGRLMHRMDVWCNSPQDVMTEAARLQPGEHLLVNTWQVVFNTAFDQLEEQGIEVAEGRSTRVRVNGRLVWIRRIRTDRRPPHTAISAVRDARQGHQLLVMKDGATGRLRLYEPEVTASGRHFEDLAADGSNFQRYFQDHPDVGIYNYIQILGKLRPSPLASTGGTAAGTRGP